MAEWFTGRRQLVLPWLRADTRWQVVAGEMLLDRAAPGQIHHLWPLLRRWATPADTLQAKKELLEIGGWINRRHRAERIADVAAWLVTHPGQLDNDETARTVPGVIEAVADLAVLAVPTAGQDDSSEEPVLATKGVLRVAARFSGHPVDRRNRRTHGRQAVARMIGEGRDARDAHLGLVELANSLCPPGNPYCPACPLQRLCAHAARDAGADRLF